jgi:hypothetical protein
MSERKALTDRMLAALKPAAKLYDVLDPARKGLMVRVTPAGTKTFFFRYKQDGRATRITIGHYPLITLRQAYETHAEFTRRLHRREALQTAIPRASAEHTPAAPAVVTVGDLADEFLKRFVYRERKRPEDAEQVIETNILKPWRQRPAKDITRRDAIVLLDRIVDRGAPVWPTA